MIENFFNEIIKILNSEHPIRAFFESTYHVLSYIWNYQIFVTAAKEKILVANVLIGIVLLIIGLRYAKHLSKLVRKKILKNMDFGTATSLERLSHYFFMALIAYIYSRYFQCTINRLYCYRNNACFRYRSWQ